MAGRCKKPAEMTPAMPTEGIAPDITGKPGEVGGGNTSPLTAGRQAIAAQLKNDPRGIKEGMSVRPLDRDFAVPAGHRSATRSTVYGIYRAGIFLLLLFFYRLTRAPTLLLVPKPIAGIICCLHRNIPR